MIPLIIAAASTLMNMYASGQQEKENLKRSISQNQAITKSNLENTIRTGYRVGLLNVQLGAAKQAAAGNKLAYGKQGLEALGAVNANQAASGTIGASTEAVANDIKKKVEEAQSAVDVGYETTQLNYNTQLNDIITAGQDSIQKSVSTPKSASDTMQALQAAGGIASSYFSSKMDLGLGDANTTSYSFGRSQYQTSYDPYGSTSNLDSSGNYSFQFK